MTHTMEEVRQTSLLYNTLRKHLYNVCIIKMRLTIQFSTLTNMSQANKVKNINHSQRAEISRQM